MRNVPIRTLLAATLLAVCGLLAGCSRTLDTRDVREFIDKADAAARKRFAPDICALRGRDFTLQVNFQGHEERIGPTNLEMNRKLFCREAGKFSQLQQYRLERKSIDIHLASDRKTARVTALYVETMPYYQPGMMPRTLDDFFEWQIVETRDESVVGIEDGDLVFLSTRMDASQTLVPKAQIQLPWD